MLEILGDEYNPQQKIDKTSIIPSENGKPRPRGNLYCHAGEMHGGGGSIALSSASHHQIHHKNRKHNSTKLTHLQEELKRKGTREVEKGKTYPIFSKIFPPLTETCVCNGAFGTYSPSQTLLCAKKGARPVAVGPAHISGLVWKYCGTEDVELRGKG